MRNAAHIHRLTTRWQAGAATTIQAGSFLTGIRIEYAAQRRFSQTQLLRIGATLLLQRQLHVIQNHRAQAPPKPVLHMWSPPLRSPPQVEVRGQHPRPQEEGTVATQGPGAGGHAAPLALHNAVIQRQNGEVWHQLQGQGVPDPIVERPPGDTQTVVAVQLELQLSLLNLPIRGKGEGSKVRGGEC